MDIDEMKGLIAIALRLEMDEEATANLVQAVTGSRVRIRPGEDAIGVLHRGRLIAVFNQGELKAADLTANSSLLDLVASISGGFVIPVKGGDNAGGEIA